MCDSSEGRVMMFYRLLILVFFYFFCSTPADSRVIQKRAAFYIANETMCIVDGDVYRNGDPVPTDDECERCTCRPPGFSCVLRDCDTKPGCKAVRKVGECCPEYVCGCVHNNRLYEDGELIKDLQNNCYTCRCHGSSISCIFADCHFRGDCQPEYVQGECCPRYDHCPPISTTTTTTTRATPPPDEVQQEIDFINFTTQHLQKFTEADTTVTLQDVFTTDSGLTTPAYEISKETLHTVKFTLSSEKLSSIHDFEISELTTLLPLQSVTYKEVTRYTVPPSHTERTTLKDEVIVVESDKTTIEQQGETEVEVEVTTSRSELDSSKDAVSDTDFANVDGRETTKYEADDIKSSVTKDGIFAASGIEKSTEMTTDSPLKITEVIESEISTLHEQKSSIFASDSKISTIKQDYQTELLQPVFVTTVTPVRSDTTTHQPEIDHTLHPNISDDTVVELHTNSDGISTQDTPSTSTEYPHSSIFDTSSSDFPLNTGEKLSEVSTLDDLDLQSTNLQTSDSIHENLQTSDSTHDDLPTSMDNDLHTSEPENDDLHSSTRGNLAFSTTTLGHSDDLHTDDEGDFDITDNSASSIEELTTEGDKIDIFHSSSDDSHKFHSEHEVEISTSSDETGVTTHEYLSSISGDNDLSTSEDDRMKTITSIKTEELQTTDDNTVTFDFTGQETESSVHHEYTDSAVSKSTYDDVRTSTEISDTTHISESHESSDIHSFTISHDDESLKSKQTTGISDFDKEITSTDRDLSVTPEEDLEELDSSEVDLSTILHKIQLTTESSSLLETDKNVDETYSTHSNAVGTSEHQILVNESGLQEITTEAPSVTGSAIEDDKSSFHYTGSSHLTKVPSSDNMDISELTDIRPSTIDTELDLTTDVAHSTFKPDMTDLESDAESVSITPESLSTVLGDLVPSLMHTEEELQKETANVSKITSITITENDSSLDYSKEKKTTEFVPYLSTENDISDANGTNNDSITVIKDDVTDEDTNPIAMDETTMKQTSESDIIIAENSEISTYSESGSHEEEVKGLNETKFHDGITTGTESNSLVTIPYTENDRDVSKVFPSATDIEENVGTAEDYSTTHFDGISTELLTSTHHISESELTTKENLDGSPEELQTSETPSDVKEITVEEVSNNLDEVTPIHDDIYSSKKPYTVTDHTTLPVEGDSDNKFSLHPITNKLDKVVTETNLDTALGTLMTTLTVLQSTTDEIKSDEVKEAGTLQVKQDTGHLSTHKEGSTQSTESIKIPTLKPTVETSSPTPENGLPNEIPGFEPPLANILKQPMLFNRPTANKEDSQSLLPLESSQTKSSNHSDENDIVRLSLTLAEEESGENGTQHNSLTDNVPESDESNVFVLNHEYTISDSEVNDIDFLDAEEIDLVSEETGYDAHTAGDEEPLLSSTPHSLSTMNVPHLQTSTVEASTKIDVADATHIDNDDIALFHSSEESTDSIETKEEIANNKNILQFNSISEVSEELNETDSSLAGIHNIDSNLVNSFEGVNHTDDSQTSESVSNDEVPSAVRDEYFSTVSEALSSIENTEATTDNSNTVELVSNENSDLISLESNENNESEISEITHHESALNGESQENLDGTTKGNSIIPITIESSVHDIGNDDEINEDSTEELNAFVRPITEESLSESEDALAEESDNSQDVHVQTDAPFSHQNAEAQNTEHDYDDTEQETKVYTNTAEYNSPLHPDLLTVLHDISSTLDTKFQTSESVNETVSTHDENYSEPSTTEDNGLESTSTIKVNILFGQNFFDSSKLHGISPTDLPEKKRTTQNPVHFHIDNEDSLTNIGSELEIESSSSFDAVEFDHSEHDANTDLKENNEVKITSQLPIVDYKPVEVQDGEVYDDSLTNVDSDSSSQENLQRFGSESTNEITDSSLSSKDITTGNDLIASDDIESLENASSTDLINNAEESSSPFTILEYIGDLFSTFSTLSDVNSESTENQNITSTKDEDLNTSEHDSQASELSIKNSSGTNAFSSLLKNQFSQYGYLGGIYITGQSKYNGSLKENSQHQTDYTFSEHLTTDNEVSTQSSELVQATASNSTDEKDLSTPENDHPTDTPNFEPPLAHIFKHPMFANKESNSNLHKVDGSLSSTNKDYVHDNGTSTLSTLENFGTDHHNSDSETEVNNEVHHSEIETEIIESTSDGDIALSTDSNEDSKSEASENIEILDSEVLLNSENLDEHHENTISSVSSTLSTESNNPDVYVTTTNSDANKDISEVHTVLLTSTLATLEEATESEIVESYSNDNNSLPTESEIIKEEGPEKEGEYFEPTEPPFPFANSVSDEQTFDTASNTNSEAQTSIITEKHQESETTGAELETVTETSSISDVKPDITSSISHYIDSSTIVEDLSDKPSTLIINNDESFSTTALPNTEPSILDVSEKYSDSAIMSLNVPPLPILLKNMNEDNVRTHVSETLPLEVDRTSLNDSANSNISLTETDQDRDVETSTRFGHGRSHVHPLHLTDVISHVFKAPGYDSEFRSNLYQGFLPSRKVHESRLKRDAKDFSEKIHPVASDTDSSDTSISNDPTSVAVGEDYSINNKNILLVQEFGRKPSEFFPVTSSLIIVQSDEETEDNEYKKNAKRKETRVQPKGDVLEVEFHNVAAFESPSKAGKSSDFKKTHSVK